MKINYGDIFQEKSKDRKMRGYVNISEDISLWPPEWKEVIYKNYDRFEKINLPAPTSMNIDQSLLSTRRTNRKYSGRSLDKQTISNILFYSAGITRKSSKKETYTRIQASAGARYPIELYYFNFKDDELGKYAYHYDVLSHSLSKLFPLDLEFREGINKYFTDKENQNSTGAFVLTAVKNRSIMKYGERGWRYIYIESGIILGNLQNNLFINNINSTIMGATNESSIENFLDLDKNEETVILSILIG